MDTTLLPNLIAGGTSGILNLNIDENSTLIADFDSNLSGTSTFRIATAADQTFAQDSEFFTINASTGVLSFNNAPDFENPLDQDGDNIYQVDVLVTNGTESVIEVIDVQVNDVEEGGSNPPAEQLEIIGNTFPAIGNISIDENETFVLDVDTNVDSNLLPGEVITFRLLEFPETAAEDLEFFSINPNTGVLSFNNAPDFENPLDSNGDNVYEVTFAAESNLGGFTAQTIDVTVNNLALESVEELEIIGNTFPAIGNISIDENESFVLDVDTNVDSNLLPGEVITFRLLEFPETAAEDLEFFSINPNTGVLSFNNAPDFENPLDSNGDNVYEVTFAAESNLGGFAAQTIDVTVNDVEEGGSNPPVEELEIIGNTFPAIGNISINENESFVLDVDTNADSDLLPGEVITFRLLEFPETAAEDLEFFSIDPNTGVLSFNNAPDFENPLDSDGDNVYEVTFAAESSLGGFAAQTIDVTVENVDSEGGVLDQLEITGNTPGEVSNFSIDENNAFVVNANTNADSNPGETITFSILDSSESGAQDSEFFTINSNTGVLSFNNAPDFENPLDQDGDNVYQVDIQATSSLGGSTVQLIDVTVDDIEEGDSTGPVLGELEIIGNTSGQVTNFSVAENNSFVVDVDTNADSNSGETITFSILNSGNSGAQDPEFFSINSNTGVLSFNNAPDFENPLDEDGDNIYQVDIQATSSLGGSTVQLIDVIVEDVVTEIPQADGNSDFV